MEKKLSHDQFLNECEQVDKSTTPKIKERAFQAYQKMVLETQKIITSNRILVLSALAIAANGLFFNE